MQYQRRRDAMQPWKRAASANPLWVAWTVAGKMNPGTSWDWFRVREKEPSQQLGHVKALSKGKSHV